MSRTITALFENRNEAESARERISTAGNVSDVRILDQSTTGSSEGQPESEQHRSWFEKLFMPDDDRETFSEGMRRGHFMLCAQVDDEDDADRIVDLLEETNAVDVDERAQGWRSEGWQPQSSQSSTFAGSSSDAFATGSATGYRETGAQNVGEERVRRGGGRVRSYSQDRPETNRGAFGFNPERDGESTEESRTSTEFQDDNFGRR